MKDFEDCKVCGYEFEFHTYNDGEYIRYDTVVYCECCGPETDYTSGIRWKAEEFVCDDCSKDVTYI